MLKKQNILGVGITTASKKDILEYAIDNLRRGSKKLFITTPNPEILVYAQKHLAYKDKLNSSDVALLDGVGLSIAGRLLGVPLQERITGVDFIEELCKAAREKPVSMGFLGGRGRVAELTAECLKKKYPWIEVVFIAEEWGEAGFVNKEVSSMKYLVSSKESLIQNTKYKILNTNIDILFVAYGFPKQENWIAEHLEKIPVKAAMGVGGAFDYISGQVPRAPRLLRKLGLEWLFRLVRQPWRIKRQFALLEFGGLIFKELRSKNR